MASMPPDLDRLGVQLAAAAGRTRDARRARSERRRRFALAGVLGAIALAFVAPGPLAPATRQFTLAATIGPPMGCETPRGAGFMLERCEPARAAEPHRPYAWR